MAGAHCATFSSVATSIIPGATARRKRLLSASLPKPTRRRNSLRPKILTKPPPNPVISIVSPETKTEAEADSKTPPEPRFDFESPTDQLSGENHAADSEEGNNVEEFRASETSREYAGTVGNFSGRSVLKYGPYFVGIFVLQTICAVWVLGNAKSHRKDRNFDDSDSDISEDNKGKLLFNKNGMESGASNVVYAHDPEVERKIEEIRAMAREARKNEAKGVKEETEDDDDDIGEESASSRHRGGIEKEIGARLINLQKRLNSVPEKLPGYVNYLGKSEKAEDGPNMDNSGPKGANGTLMFKKKFKYRGPSSKRVDGPKGFQDTRDRNLSNVRKSGSGSARKSSGNGGIGDDGAELTQEVISLAKDGKVMEEERGRSGLGIEKGVGTAKQRNGVVQEPSLERPSVQVVNSQESVKLGTHSQRLRDGNRKTTTTSDKHAALNTNGVSKRREVGDGQMANKLRGKQPDIETEFWWLSLPYVLVVLMRRGSDHEGQGGLYTLKNCSQAQGQSKSSYTVAFEDRVDANNFCLLLESFFEDMGDFRADIAPLPIKELHEAVKADTMNVIVVKKRQLQLYAGQPFADVEMALHSLVKEDQSSSTPTER